jgi:hypothetical protein
MHAKKRREGDKELYTPISMYTQRREGGRERERTSAKPF